MSIPSQLQLFMNGLIIENLSGSFLISSMFDAIVAKY